MTGLVGALPAGSDAATGTRPKSEVRRRTHGVHVRMTDDEYDRYTALAEQHRMSLPELMRLAVDVVLMQEQVRDVGRT